MNRNTVIVVFALVFTAACASQKPVVVEQPAPVAEEAPPVEAPTVEVAQGEVREALLRLQRVHFALDAATLSPEAQVSVAAAAKLLADYPEIHLYVEGHTDQRGKEGYNMALGKRRAQAVVDSMAAQGIDRERLHVGSKGKKALVDKKHNTVAMARNRRVEFRLMRGDVQLVLEEGTLLDDRGRTISLR